MTQPITEGSDRPPPDRLMLSQMLGVMLTTVLIAIIVLVAR